MSVQKIKQQSKEWLDITSPTKADRAYLEKKCDFEEVDIAYAFAKTLRTKITPRQGYTFLVTLVPSYNKEKESIELHEVDIFLTPTQLITIHQQPITALVDLHAELKSNIPARRALFNNGTKHVLFMVMETLLEHTDDMIDTLNDELESLKKDIFSGTHGTQMVNATLNMRHSVTEMRKAVRGFLTILTHIHTQKNLEYFEGLHDYASELWDNLESHKELIEALEDANETIIAHNLNGVLRLLTMFSAVLLPASVTAGIFGMNAKNMPLVGHSIDFWLMLAGVVGSSLVVLLVFAYKRLIR